MQDCRYYIASIGLGVLSLLLVCDACLIPLALPMHLENVHSYLGTYVRNYVESLFRIVRYVH